MRRLPTGCPGVGRAGCANGEFDTPIDPRFPTYLATNLSEALPGPFSPSSASVTVQGLRAGGAMIIAARLRPGGLIEREMATRTIGVFAHCPHRGDHHRALHGRDCSIRQARGR